MVWARVGSSTLTGWKRRARAVSFSKCLRYSSRVVARSSAARPGQHRLEDGGGVDGTLSRACPDQRVQLVDEQDDVATGPYLLHHLLQALLEVAPVAGPATRAPRSKV